jgi:hypothetical protein
MANPNDVKRALDGDLDLRGADLTGADLRRVDLRGADLSEAILKGAKLMGAKLMGAKLILADLERANLSGADLTNADLSGASLKGVALILVYDLEGANITGADLTNAELSINQFFYLKGLTLEQKMSLYGSTSMKKGDILSSKTNPEEYRVVSVRERGGKITANIVNTKNKKRYAKRVYQKDGIGSGVILYVKNLVGDVFLNWR